MAVPTVRRRRLGAELRKIREDRGLSLDEVGQADGLGITTTKLSRLETARSAAKMDDVVKLLDFYQYDNGSREALLALVKDGSKRGWWLPYGDILGPVYADLISLESEASKILTYEPLIIPGLAQTAAYARAAIKATRIREAGPTVEEKITVRMARQSVLTRPGGPQFWLVIHEGALTVRIGDDGSVMREQMQRLLDLSKLPNVDIQVMPADAAPHPGILGSFTILGFPERSDLDVVHTERLLSSVYIEDPSEVEQYGVAFQRITAEALPQEASLRFITQQRDKISE